MSSGEGAKIETKSVLGEVHPGRCWSNWDPKAAECKLCSIAERCSESTKRIQNTTPPSVVPAPKQKSAPVKAPAPVLAKAEPVKAVAAEPVKPEPVKAVAAEPAKTKPVKEDAPITTEHLVELVKEHIGKDASVQTKDGVLSVIYTFFGAAPEWVFQLGVLKDGKTTKLLNPKGSSRLLQQGYQRADVLAALKELTV